MLVTVCTRLWRHSSGSVVRSRPSSPAMNSLPEITHLFTKLASDLRPPNSAPVSVARAIHSVASSLNDDDDEEKLNRGVRVLDAALSIMCFKTPEVPLVLLLLFPLPFPIFIDLSLSLIAPHFRYAELGSSVWSAPSPRCSPPRSRAASCDLRAETVPSS